MISRHSTTILFSIFFLTLVAILALGQIGVQAGELEQSSETPTPTGDDELDEQPYEDFDPTNFDNPTAIDNPWFPLQPGMRYTYEGTTADDDELIPHIVITTVTDLVKEIDGINTVVIWDQDFSDDELVETEIAFFAQDNDGNVWRMGEHPEEYEDGELVEAPTWIAGQADAVAGIAMKADPQLNAPSYSQGWAPEVEFTDRAQVFAMGEENCVPFECYTDVLVTDEFNPEEPDAFQQKYYAPGVGLIRVGWRGDNEENQEVLELVSVEELDEEGLAEARAAAFELDENAYEISEEVYAATGPLE